MYQRILVVVDSSPASRAAVLEGTALAKALGSEVLFFTVLPSYFVPVADMPMYVADSAEQYEHDARNAANRILAAAKVVADKAGVVSHTASSSGADPALVIASAARRRKCNAIVVASEGRNALLRLLTGSVIPGLITASSVPVVVCKFKATDRSKARSMAAPKKPQPVRKMAAASKVRRPRAK